MSYENELREGTLSRRQMLRMMAGAATYAMAPYANAASRGNVTAYTLVEIPKRPGHPDYGKTKLGTTVKLGKTVAVDPRWVKLGSEIYMPLFDPNAEDFRKLEKELQDFLIGHEFDGHFRADDTGRLVKGRDRVDVYFGPGKEHYHIANEFGRRHSPVTVLK